MKKIDVFANSMAGIFDAGVMYRLIMPYDYLGRQLGQDVQFKIAELNKPTQLSINGDIVVFHYQWLIGDNTTFEIAKKLGKKIVVDIDDWIVYPKSHPLCKVNIETRMIEKLLMKLKQVDLITVSTLPLKNKLSEIIKVPIEVLPNSLPEKVDGIDLLPQPEKLQTEKLRFGYLGGIYHESDMKMIKGVFYELFKKVGDCFEVCVIRPDYKKRNIYTDILFNGMQTPIKIHNLDLQPFSHFFNLYNKFDVAIAPLERNDFNECKSSIKFLEAAKMGRVFIGSCVYPYFNTVSHGQNGFTCINKNEWIEVMVDLIKRPEQIQRIVEYSKVTVDEKLNFEKIQIQRLDILKQFFSRY